jgi:hypothetical protein
VAFTGRPSAAKRQKEIARQQRQKEKAEKRAQKKGDPKRAPGEGEEDPDIAGIVPGPQPPTEDAE